MSLQKSSRCPECSATGSHVLGCSYGPNVEDRKEFIRQNAVDLVERLEAKIRRQAKAITQLETTNRALKKQLALSKT